MGGGIVCILFLAYQANRQFSLDVVHIFLPIYRSLIS